MCRGATSFGAQTKCSKSSSSYGPRESSPTGREHLCTATPRYICNERAEDPKTAKIKGGSLWGRLGKMSSEIQPLTNSRLRSEGWRSGWIHAFCRSPIEGGRGHSALLWRFL